MPPLLSPHLPISRKSYATFLLLKVLWLVPFAGHWPATHTRLFTEDDCRQNPVGKSATADMEGEFHSGSRSTKHQKDIGLCYQARRAFNQMVNEHYSVRGLSLAPDSRPTSGFSSPHPEVLSHWDKMVSTSYCPRATRDPRDIGARFW